MTSAIARRSFLAAGVALGFAACAGTRRRGASVAHPATPTAPPPTPPLAPRGPALFVRSGSTGRSEVAFTFHGSGDVAALGALLDAARRLAAPITVFAVGKWLDANPRVARMILAGGHELANHTYTHPALARSGRAEIADEITRCRDALTRHAGSPGTWFRPSGVEVPTGTMLEEAGRAGYTTVVGYDVDPRDYQDPGAATVAARTAQGLHTGAIVSLHTGHAGTVAAFEPMLTAARDRGLRPVLVRDLLAYGTR